MHVSVNTTNATMCGMSLATVFEINQKKLFGTIIFLKRKNNSLDNLRRIRHWSSTHFSSDVFFNSIKCDPLSEQVFYNVQKLFGRIHIVRSQRYKTLLSTKLYPLPCRCFFPLFMIEAYLCVSITSKMAVLQSFIIFLLLSFYH